MTEPIMTPEQTTHAALIARGWTPPPQWRRIVDVPCPATGQYLTWGPDVIWGPSGYHIGYAFEIAPPHATHWAPLLTPPADGGAA